MNNYIKNLEAGNHLLVEEGNQYFIVSPYKDARGNYRISSWWSSEKEARENFCRTKGYDKNSLQKLFDTADKVSIWKPKYKRYEIGEDVVFKGEIYVVVDYVVVDGVYDSPMSYLIELHGSDTFNDGNERNVSHTELSYPLPLDEKTEEAIALLKEKGFKIVKE